MMPLYQQILAAVLLDILLGDPRKMPHPVQLYAFLGTTLERAFGTVSVSRRTAGVLTWISVIVATLAGVTAVRILLRMVHPLAADIFSIYLLYTCFAARSLAGHGMAVFRELQSGNLADARIKVGMICSRQTDQMSEEEVCRAAVESTAENFSDGITAPLLFAFLGGPVLAVMYKVISTMDSTFGYKNERYLEFGWLSAKADDAANILPARISGFCIVVSSWVLGLDAGQAWNMMIRDAKKHDSPNAGYPEAAMAGALGVRLGGRSRYFGKVVDKPVLGDPVRPLKPGHIRTTVAVTILGSVIVLSGGTALRVLTG